MSLGQLNNHTNNHANNEQTTQYTFYVNTRNRQQSNNIVPNVYEIGSQIVQTNETNDVIIPCNITTKNPCNMITLASLEMPLEQSTIEPPWRNLDFDEGTEIMMHNSNDLELCRFTIVEASGPVTIMLPPKLNPITNITPNGIATTSATFTTQYPHCLHLSTYLLSNYSVQYMRIISTPLHTNNQINLHLTPNLTIIDDYTFSWTWTGAVTFNIPTNPLSYWGYIQSPNAPNPLNICVLLSNGFKSLNKRWIVDYNIDRGRCTLSWVGPMSEASSVFPAYLNISTSNSLRFVSYRKYIYFESCDYCLLSLARTIDRSIGLGKLQTR